MAGLELHCVVKNIFKIFVMLKLILSFNYVIVNASKTKGGVGNEVG
jgi:hypothetical protein